MRNGRSLARLGLLVLLSGCSTLTPRPAPAPVPPPSSPPASAPVSSDTRRSEPAIRAWPRSRYGNPASYEVFGRRYVLLPTAAGHVERGTASWYGPGFHGERTSSGDAYDMYAFTAAHRTLPMPVVAQVTNLRNGRTVRVLINDRGPFVGERILDLSYAAAVRLDMLREGTAPIELRVISGETPALLPGAATPPTASAAITSTWLQTGSFASVDNANAQRAALMAAGISNIEVGETVAGQRRWYRVRVGPIDSAVEAEDMIERLRVAGVPDARLAHE